MFKLPYPLVAAITALVLAAAPVHAQTRDVVLPPADFTKVATGQAEPAWIDPRSDLSGTALKGVAGLTSEDRQIFWQFFFRGAIVEVVHPVKSQTCIGPNCQVPGIAVVGYYNPFIDAWLISDWRMKNGQPVLRGTQLVLADALAGAFGQDISAAPDWINTARDQTAEALAKRTVDTVRAFRDWYRKIGPRGRVTQVLADAAAQNEIFALRTAALLIELAQAEDLGIAAAAAAAHPEKRLLAVIGRNAEADLFLGQPGPLQAVDMVRATLGKPVLTHIETIKLERTEE